MGNETITTNELVELCSVDDQLFCRTFFPRTFRQGFPHFWDEETSILEHPDNRYVGLKRFRGSAKTTRLRAFVAKRISYAISNTIGFVSNAQKHSIFSLKWIRKQVEFNTFWAETFGLIKGSTWNDEHLEIIHKVDGRVVNLLALGITGQVRGINIDDYRFDLIVVDDPDSAETTHTPEQREKTSDLIFGDLQKSLAPPTENPTAKMVILQTPFNKFDTISTCEKSPMWRVSTIGCFDEQGNSTWEERFPTSFLVAEKQEHLRMNKAALWMREMECKIISAETASFELSWLKYWTEQTLPPLAIKYIGIDPASSENKNADDQVVCVVGFRGPDVYVLEYTAEKGEMPDAAATTFISYLTRHAIHRVVVESIGYQRILAWYLQNAMRTNKRWAVINQLQDKRKKSDRIIQAFQRTAANGHLYVHASQQKFIEQFAEYRPGVEMHDDVLDAVAMAISDYKDHGVIEGDYSVVDEKDIPDLQLNIEACP